MIKTNDERDLDRLLDDGWEPYAVTYDSHTYRWYYFRRPHQTTKYRSL